MTTSTCWHRSVAAVAALTRPQAGLASAQHSAATFRGSDRPPRASVGSATPPGLGLAGLVSPSCHERQGDRTAMTSERTDGPHQAAVVLVVVALGAAGEGLAKGRRGEGSVLRRGPVHTTAEAADR